MTEMLAANHHTYRKFSSVLDRSIYEPLPDSWIIGMTDVVGSTVAIQEGRYEDVNFLGASIIAAVGNEIGNFDFPFSFGGDGATFALPGGFLTQAKSALGQIARLSRNRFNLEMRAGLLPVEEVRRNGRDVRIARYAVSRDATYFMFAGGGLRWAERELKKGRFIVQGSPADLSEPDLNGLSCEWNPFKSQRGTILSLLVEPRDTASDLAFSEIARDVMQVFEEVDNGSSPLPTAVPVRKDGLDSVDPETWAAVASNSDFRKFDDVLRLTVDCTLAQVEEVERLLRSSVDRGDVRYGLHRQSHAIMTCLVPGTNADSHLHFLDGRDGGFAKAAAMLRLTS
ncbi:DUF3095 family protein [Pararhizobium qamdonense]|uniref:DUF3095 family protein n=1 Tax=Pararhizobium qamdonense TaxID=3031126 RepID=UPI0023E2D717|nr:DUF3095 family protein [Pararhizobium qamdonense]